MQIIKRLSKKFKLFYIFLGILFVFAELSPLIHPFMQPAELSSQKSYQQTSERLPLGLLLSSSVGAAEIENAVYYGDSGATAVLGNLGYTDVSRTNWSIEAIYETGALGIIKGYNGTNSRFGRTVPLTKEEAIAIAYRAAGRETEAQQLGIAVNNVRAAANKKTDPLEVMYDGFLQLAANEGIITARNLTDAFNTDQSALTADSFRRKSPAQRQEMAYWLAKTLNIAPIPQQRELMNYSDWRSVDPDKLPFLESLFQKGIMTGSNGRINPTQPITREQGAQIIKNAEEEVLESLKYLKSLGVVGEISATKDYTDDITATGKKITISNADGTSASILTSVKIGTTSGAKNENEGVTLAGQKRELVVYRNGILGNSNLLEKGDRIQYITDSTNTVKYIYVISNINDVSYLAVQVNGVDKTNLLMDAIQLFEMNYPDINSISGDQSFAWSKTEKSTYRIAPGAPVTINGVKADLSGVTDDATAILTFDSNKLINEIQCVDFGINTEARRIFKGIVEENNPDLGYITLFNDDGSGTGSGNSAVLRTYNFVDQNKTQIYRNHKVVKADSIQAGDTAYIRLNKDGDIESISAVSNYVTKYGRVASKLPSEIVVEYDDGTQQLLSTDKNVVVIRDRLLVGLKALKDGDRIRLLLNINDKNTDLKEITIEGDEHYISNVYKGTITKIDNMSDKITVMGLQVFNKGIWERTEWKGFKTILLSDDYRIFSENTLLDSEDANKLLYSNEAYIAVERTYGGEEKAVLLSYRNSMDTAVPLTGDTISNVISGSENFMLSRENQKVNYSDGSIVVKYGRLVTGNSLSNNDTAYFALNRDYSTGNYYASVVKIDEPQVASGITVYRGRISEINDGKDFTIESFSQLQGTDWRYSNTPKTFNITFDTRVLIEEGILNIRDFKGYGEDSYLRRTVYVVADGINSVLVSTAPYGIENIKGTVFAKDNKQIELRKVSTYDAATYMWVNRADASIDLLENTVIIRNGRVSNSADIVKGVSVRVLKKDSSLAGDGYIIFVE